MIFSVLRRVRSQAYASEGDNAGRKNPTLQSGPLSPERACAMRPRGRRWVGPKDPKSAGVAVALLEGWRAG